MAIVLVGLSYPQETLADGFTGKDFAEWSKASQDSYIQSSMTMAGVIGTQIQPEISVCVDSWYFGNRAARNDDIRATIIKYETYHPSGVLLAILQDACGKFE